MGFDIEWRVTFKKGKRTGNYGHSGLRSTFETAVTLYVDSPCPAFSPTASAFICCCCSSAVDTPISAKCTHAGEVPRPAALVQLAYRWHRPGAGQPPYTCVLLHVAASGLTPALRALLQSPHPPKVVWEWNFAYLYGLLKFADMWRPRRSGGPQSRSAHPAAVAPSVESFCTPAHGGLWLCRLPASAMAAVHCQPNKTTGWTLPAGCVEAQVTYSSTFYWQLLQGEIFKLGTSFTLIECLCLAEGGRLIFVYYRASRYNAIPNCGTDVEAHLSCRTTLGGSGHPQRRRTAAARLGILVHSNVYSNT